MKKLLSSSLIALTLLFSVNTQAQFTKMMDFHNYEYANNESNPYGNIISDGTFLYDLSWLGGINDRGSVFKIQMKLTFLKTQKEYIIKLFDGLEIYNQKIVID